MSGAIPLTEALLRTIPLPSHDGVQDKDSRGRVLVIGGSTEVPGAALLAAVGALRAGAGKLQIATCGRVAIGLGLAVPEALVVGLPETPDGGVDPRCARQLAERAEKVDAVLLGPGMTDQPAVDALRAALIADTSRPALIFDAAALNALAEQAWALAPHQARVVLTPHAGEMAGMLGISRKEVLADREAVARRAAGSLNAVVALKGECTVVAAPDGRTWLYGGGGIGMATSGSGDTLAGIVTGLLARGTEPITASLWAVLLHGEAGRRLCKTRGPLGFLARELLAEIPPLMCRFSE